MYYLNTLPKLTVSGLVELRFSIKIWLKPKFSIKKWLYTVSALLNRVKYPQNLIAYSRATREIWLHIQISQPERSI